jgi:hypothetical protein
MAGIYGGDYAVLQTELNTDPQALGLAAKIAASDWGGAATLLNVKSFTGAATIPLDTLERHLIEQDILFDIDTYRVSGANSAGKRAANFIWYLLQSARIQTYPTAGRFTTAINALRTNSVITNPQATAIGNLAASASLSRAEVLLRPGVFVTDDDVKRALGVIV